MLEAFRSTTSYKVAGFVACPVAFLMFLLDKYVMIGMGVLLGMIPYFFIYFCFSCFFIPELINAWLDKGNVKYINTNLFADIGCLLGIYIVTGIWIKLLILFIIHSFSIRQQAGWVGMPYALT